ncbi:hypothetical protein D9619_004843 [Psilocybe cf. subviscida]|uniref:Initiator tRNA phosphoribosyl transferase n=1 Tax=Psilocybe cf. subviscida TaxID=2480587 RepID=A0A8H5F8T0_9AGAR|nr:hypothetical protein D9619_004843 [Psilocybe cf. subviscida]
MDNHDTLTYLRKESLDIYNRLHSIEEDIVFVDQVQMTYPTFPFLPNLRCGAWYTNPEISAKIPAYFKSTDGHNNNWSFNLRRANLHLLPHILESGGLILVDSTRSGKRIPDALSKTVPIWCTVINRAMLILHPHLRENDGTHGKQRWDTTLYTPPSTVSKVEHHEIEKRLDGWAKALAASSFTLPTLTWPLRPVWITPATSTFPRLPSGTELDGDTNREFFPIVCVSASKQIDQGVERRSSGFSYVQGSGDDHELWGMGLTPDVFWAHRQQFLSADRTHLPDLVAQILSTSRTKPAPVSDYETVSPIVKVQGRLLVGVISDPPDVSTRIAIQDNLVYVILTPSEDLIPPIDSDPSLVVPTCAGKKGQSHFLHKVLPPAVEFIKRHLRSGLNVCIVCETGRDLSVGVALVALQLFFTDDGSFVPQDRDSNDDVAISKSSIRTRLEWLIASRPQANPSRATLKRVNEYLLTSRLFAPVNIDTRHG